MLRDVAAKKYRDRSKAILEMKINGKPLTEIAKHYHISKQRVKQIISKTFYKPTKILPKPKTYMDYLKEAKERDSEDRKLYKNYHPEFYKNINKVLFKYKI